MNIGLIALYWVGILVVLWFMGSAVKEWYHKYKLKIICEKNPELDYLIHILRAEYKEDRRYNAKQKSIEQEIDKTLKEIRCLPREDRNTQKSILRSLQHNYKKIVYERNENFELLKNHKARYEQIIKEQCPKYQEVFHYILINNIDD